MDIEKIIEQVFYFEHDHSLKQNKNHYSRFISICCVENSQEIYYYDTLLDYIIKPLKHDIVSWKNGVEDYKHFICRPVSNNTNINQKFLNIAFNKAKENNKQLFNFLLSNEIFNNLGGLDKFSSINRAYNFSVYNKKPFDVNNINTLGKPFLNHNTNNICIEESSLQFKHLSPAVFQKIHNINNFLKDLKEKNYHSDDLKNLEQVLISTIEAFSSNQKLKNIFIENSLITVFHEAEKYLENIVKNISMNTKIYF